MTNTDHNLAGKLLVKNAHGYQVVKFDDILYCDSMGGYTNIHLINDEAILSSHIMKELESQLPEEQFFRVSRSCLINLDYVVKYQSSPRNSVILQNNMEIRISTRKIPKIASFLKAHYPLV